MSKREGRPHAALATARATRSGNPGVRRCGMVQLASGGAGNGCASVASSGAQRGNCLLHRGEPRCFVWWCCDGHTRMLGAAGGGAATSRCGCSNQPVEKLGPLLDDGGIGFRGCWRRSWDRVMKMCFKDTRTMIRGCQERHHVMLQTYSRGRNNQKIEIAGNGQQCCYDNGRHSYKMAATTTGRSLWRWSGVGWKLRVTMPDRVGGMSDGRYWD